MKKRLILYGIMIIAIILGITVISLKDFNYAITYANHKRLEVTINKEYNINDVKSIVKETIKDKAVVRQTTLFKTGISIEAKNITDEEINNLIGKLNEKYQTDLDIKQLKRDEVFEQLNVTTSVSDMEDKEVTELIKKIKDQYGLEYTKDELTSTTKFINLTDVSKVNIFDFINGLIMPAILSIVLVAIYFAVRYKKMYPKAWIVQPIKLIFEMFLTQFFIIAVFGLTRIPVNNYIVVLLSLAWMIQLIVESIKTEKEYAKVK